MLLICCSIVLTKLRLCLETKIQLFKYFSLFIKFFAFTLALLFSVRYNIYIYIYISNHTKSPLSTIIHPTVINFACLKQLSETCLFHVSLLHGQLFFTISFIKAFTRGFEFSSYKIELSKLMSHYELITRKRL